MVRARPAPAARSQRTRTRLLTGVAMHCGDPSRCYHHATPLRSFGGTSAGGRSVRRRLIWRQTTGCGATRTTDCRGRADRTGSKCRVPRQPLGVLDPYSDRVYGYRTAVPMPKITSLLGAGSNLLWADRIPRGSDRTGQGGRHFGRAQQLNSLGSWN
jgi:hypothetical protein